MGGGRPCRHFDRETGGSPGWEIHLSSQGKDVVGLHVDTSFLTLDLRTNEGGGKRSPHPEDWDTVDKARVLSGRGYGGLLLNGFLRVVSPFQSHPEE